MSVPYCPGPLPCCDPAALACNPPRPLSGSQNAVEVVVADVAVVDSAGRAEVVVEKIGRRADFCRDARLATRHIGLGGRRTTIALEAAFWREMDRLAAHAGITWQEWAAAALEGRSSTGKARWLRVILLLG